MTIHVFVDGLPKGQPRPRAFARGGHARVYDPGTAEGWKSLIALALRPWKHTRVEDAVTVSLLFFFRRPASHLTAKGVLRSSAPAEHVSRPDVDNLAKAVLDCCTAIGVWRDDTQVIDLRAEKTYSEDGRQGCSILISTLAAQRAVRQELTDALALRGAVALTEGEE